MPARATKAAGTTKKTTTRKTKATASAAQEQEPASQQIIPATPAQKTIQNAFTSSQNTTATHKKLVVTLRTLQEECSKNGTDKEFRREFIKCLNRVLVVKKGEAVGDRVMRFCDLFVRYIHEKELREKRVARQAKRQQSGLAPEDEDDEDEEEEEETAPSITTRFMTSLLKHILYGLKAANKNVRFRSCQFLALTLNSVSALDENIFAHLKDGLVKRMMDREAAVRVQASLALMKLGFGTVEESDSDSEPDDEDIGYVQGGVVGRLVDRLSTDSSADVRRAILLNMNHTPETLPHLLERSRDVDPLTRRLVYARTLPSLGDFRLLTINMREKILRWGLQDRDQAVRKAAEKTFAEGWVQNASGDLLEVLERLDVINSKVAEVALESFWKQGTGTDVDFGTEFWENLTAESSFLARTFNDYCRDPDTPFDHHIDDKIPEVTHLAFLIQKYINLLVESPPGVPLSQNGAKIAAKHDSAEVEFIVEQLLLIALKLDYGDEIGRRKMFQLLRESLAIVDLPEPTVHRIVEVLRKVSSSERDYCSVILEIIAEVHDLIAPENEVEEGNDSFHSARSDVSGGTIKLEPAKPTKPNKKKARDVDEDEDMMDVDEDEDDEDDEDDVDGEAVKEMITNLRCLFIAQCMMENVEGDLKSNAHLMTMLNGLIIPAVRSQEAPIRERGLRCLGLCCLLDKPLAEENLALFALCFNRGHEEMQIECAHIICDVLVTHGPSLFDSQLCTIEQKTLYKMFTKATKLDDSPDVQAVVIEVLCKLMLARTVEDEELLRAMVIAYFDASTSDNLSLRQTLSYFLPVYCHSRNENQLLMSKITVSTLHTLISMHANIDEGEEMVAPAVIASQFADWTDPRKVFGALPEPGQNKVIKVNYDIQLDLASDICSKLSASGNRGIEEDKKLLCQMLGKLYITERGTPEKLQELYEQVLDIIDRKTVTDAVSRNAITKFETVISKLVSIVEAEKSRIGSGGGNGGRGSASGSDAETAADETMATEMADLSIVSGKTVDNGENASEVETGTETEEQTEEEVEDDEDE